MAETIGAKYGKGQTTSVQDKVTNQGRDANAAYGYQQFIALYDANSGTQAHIILGSGVPSDVTTYDDAPLGSLYINTDGGNGVCLYVKESVEDNGNAGWAAVETGTEA